jgi:broad specificity phosphatase PhoE
VRQVRALGDALGDVPLKAVYAGPEPSAKETATTIAQRHGLVVRHKPSFGIAVEERFDEASARVVETFEAVARAGPGRTSLVVVSQPSARIVVAHCAGLAPSVHDCLALPPGSITEIVVRDDRFVVERLGDVAHLPRVTSVDD